MKKTVSAVLAVLLMLSCMVACTPADEEYVLFSLWLYEDTEKPVDTELLDAYFSSEDPENYAKAKENNPNVLSLFKNITPDEVEDKCSLYVLEGGDGSKFLNNESTYLICDGKVYALTGYSSIAQMAYRGNTLYYSYSTGFGLPRFVVSSFNLRTKKRKSSDVLGTGANWIRFVLSEDKKTLSVLEVDDWFTEETDATILYEDVRDIEWKD